jgi:hypothetical protein
MRLTTHALVIAALTVWAQTPAPPSPAAAAFAKGVELADGGHPAEAIPHFKDAVAQGFQPVFQGHFRLARAYAKSGQADLAVKELEWLASQGFANSPLLANTDLDGLRDLAPFKAAAKTIDANAHPCAADPNYHAFDFWIGEWDVQPTGQPRGPAGSGATSVIERQLDTCVIQENWLPRGPGAGKSFNIYNRVSKQWEQFYVDTLGTITHYIGSFHEDGNLYFEADQFGTGRKIRMTFFNQGPTQVRQLGHISTDGGKSWSVTFDLTYVRK